MQDSKVVYSSTGDFLKYLSTRTKEKEKVENNYRSANSIRNDVKRNDNNLRYN